ncbi:hypothetical protein CO046_04475 [Candidatus Peregrinibacteria bacterium CG_4_9_14_0_2_um_filter_53_11]|nr:MAG: hypothetical protein CO046_04475 [Candidatus Peregrinibacteria bacterium CG_4_9_14_0_2_um_filter_53_11]
MKKLLLTLVLVAQILVAPATLQAAYGIPSEYLPTGAPTISGSVKEDIQDPDKARIILTQRIVNIVTGIAGVIAIYMIASTGWRLVIGAGSEETITQEKKALAWEVGGLVLIIFAFSIIRLIIGILLTADQPVSTPQPAPAAVEAPADS